jgi:hypothetical protein
MEGNIQAAAMRIAAAAQPSSLQWPFWPTKRLMPDFLEWLYEVEVAPIHRTV